jgi:hypothetical protein
MARKILTIFLLQTAFFRSIFAYDYKHTVITDPSIGRRCEILTENRDEKVAQKQRILALIERNKYLQKKTPENKISVKNKLEINLGHLEHELSLAINQIQFQEETIIRKGCPGINL